jgi:hypothetical protein
LGEDRRNEDKLERDRELEDIRDRQFTNLEGNLDLIGERMTSREGPGLKGTLLLYPAKAPRIRKYGKVVPFANLDI